MMDIRVNEGIIEEHGHYVYPTLNAEYPMIDFDNEEIVVSLLEERGIVKCCGSGSDHAASFCSSLLSTNSPFTNLAPALTRGINR